MEQTAKDRLLLFLKALGIGQKKFEESVELSNGYVNKLKSSPSSQVIAKIVGRYPQLNPEWLINGEGEMLKGTDEHRIDTGRSVSVPRVPLLNLDVRGGYEDNIVSGNEYSEKLIPWPGAGADDFAVEVSGVSMMPRIPPGSRLLLRKVEYWQAFLELNQLYVFELKDYRRILKNAQKSDKGDDYLTLESFNPDTPNQEISISLINRVYKVVGQVTNFGF